MDISPSAAIQRRNGLHWGFYTELFFRELKRHIGTNSLLQADSENSVQGVFAAMLLAAYEVAQVRVSAAQSVEMLVLRLSIAKISRYLEQFAAVMRAGRGIISAQQAAKMERRWLKIMAREAIIAVRKPRGCQRGLRRPRSNWPVIRKRVSLDPTRVVTPISGASPSPH